jgi:3-(3-hydroxy-phenyl)propionate hydroxylase
MDTIATSPGVTGIAVGGNGLLGKRYDARPGTTYLIRPDRYVAARWRQPDPAAIDAALRRAQGRSRA